MDYDFVDNLSFGPSILSNITSYKKFFIDCHMMVKIKNKKVEDYLKPFIKAGANSITMHIEALTTNQLKEFINLKKEYQNLHLGLAINPKTSINKVTPYLKNLDLVLLMSVEPGFGGQQFLDFTETKIQEIAQYISAKKLKTLIQVDGGINDITYKKCNSANIIVLGSYLLKALSITTAINKIKKV